MAAAFVRLAWAIAFLGSFGALAEAAAENPPTSRRALLVGCTTYASLPESMHLRGPGNDVLLMRDLLTNRFRFPSGQVVILAESEGESRRPTRANIEREFRRLIESSRNGDEIVVLMAGHGSQQPDLDAPASEDSEPDGLDEIFLPADIGRWNGGAGTVENAIVDDELRDWLSEIRRRGASVWVVMDACHSGTMVRGTDDEVRRELPIDLLVPEEVLKEAAGRVASRSLAGPAERTRGGSGEEPSPLETGDGAGLVAVYAAQSNEVTVEKLLPVGSPDRKPYGLLTYTINEILTQTAEPLTYEELIRRVRNRYVNQGRTFPTPLVEGRDRRREVLGEGEWSGRPIRLKQAGKAWKVDAGSLHGLSRGSILAIAGSEGTPALGYVRLTEVRTFDATLEPCEFDDKPASPAALMDGAVCEVVSVDFGESKLRVAADRSDNLGRPVAAAEIARIAAELDTLSGEPRSRVRQVEDVSEAQWLVRRHDGRTYLLPASGVATPSATAPADERSRHPSLFGPAPEDRPLAAWLRDTFETVARAENLKRLATSAAGETVRGGKGVKVEIEPRLLAGEDDMQGASLTDAGAGFELKSGDLLTLRVKNPNAFAIDVTLLYVDSGYGINCLFPLDETNRLRTGESLAVGPVEANAETLGLEHLVAIAVAVPPGEIREPADFGVLAQPSLDLARDAERKRGGPSALDSPLGELLESAVFAEGTTRGLSVKKIEEHALTLTSFRVLPEPRP